MSNPYPNYKRNTITVPAQKRPQNCGTSYCSCIECVMESAQQEPVAYGMFDTMLGKGNRMMMVRLDKGQDGCTVPLYTSPPAQRKPLTKEDIRAVGGVVAHDNVFFINLDQLNALVGIKENT